MQWIKEEAKALEQELIAHRRWLHSHAEVGFGLEQTAAYVRQQLQSMGIPVRSCGRCGLTALLGPERGGRTLLLRSDMDALPIPEESGVPFACTGGAMHACGHDLHTAMLLGAARLLKNHELELPGQVKLMFQPSEETFEGAADMIADGVLEDPRPDGAMMIHVTAGVPMPSGTVIVCGSGVSAPAADYFTVTVRGRGCHGSAPHNGVDALTAAAHILLGFQQIQARELPASEEAVLTVGTFRGGSAPNAIADCAVLEGTVRTYSEETRSFLKQRMEQISGAIAQAYRADASVEFGTGCPTLVNDGELCRRMYESLKKALDPASVLNAQQLGGNMRGGGSEDFAYISQQVPSVMLALAAGNPRDGYLYPQHHPKVMFDEGVLWKGAAAFAACAFGYLSENSEG